MVAALVSGLAIGPTVAMAKAEPEQSEQRVALLPLHLKGDFNEGWLDRVEQSLTQEFTQAGMEVVDSAMVLEVSGGGGDCSTAKCFMFLSSSMEARYLVRTEITVQDRNYSLSIDIIDGTNGSLAANTRESCQLCGLTEVSDLVATQAAALRQKVDMLALEPAVLSVVSEPAGALIFIDGREIGQTPLETELDPGAHEAQARHTGYLPQSRTIDAVKGVRETIRFELLPAPTAPVAPKKSRTWKVPTGWALLGIGVGGLAAGVTFLVLDERPYRARCSGADIDASGDCRQRYGTLTHGVAFAAAGGALLVTGAALLVAARLQRGRRADTMARRLRAGPGTVGISF